MKESIIIVELNIKLKICIIFILRFKKYGIEFNLSANDIMFSILWPNMYVDGIKYIVNKLEFKVSIQGITIDIIKNKYFAHLIKDLFCFVYIKIINKASNIRQCGGVYQVTNK